MSHIFSCLWMVLMKPANGSPMWISMQVEPHLENTEYQCSSTEAQSSKAAIEEPPPTAVNALSCLQVHLCISDGQPHEKRTHSAASAALLIAVFLSPTRPSTTKSGSPLEWTCLCQFYRGFKEIPSDIFGYFGCIHDFSSLTHPWKNLSYKWKTK